MAAETVDRAPVRGEGGMRKRRCGAHCGWRASGCGDGVSLRFVGPPVHHDAALALLWRLLLSHNAAAMCGHRICETWQQPGSRFSMFVFSCNGTRISLVRSLGCPSSSIMRSTDAFRTSTVYADEIGAGEGVRQPEPAGGPQEARGSPPGARLARYGRRGADHRFAPNALVLPSGGRDFRARNLSASSSCGDYCNVTKKTARPAHRAFAISHFCSCSRSDTVARSRQRRELLQGFEAPLDETQSHCKPAWIDGLPRRSLDTQQSPKERTWPSKLHV